MSFIATKFVFDGVPSDVYGLVCGDVSGSGGTSAPTGSSVEILEEYISKKSKPYFYGTINNTKLEFDISFFSEKPIDRMMLQSIESWLVGRNTYKRLQLLQCDMYDIYYNCILTENNILLYGNNVYGISCHAVCDAPWAWGKKEIKTNKYLSNQTVSILNSSDDENYVYPTMTFYSSIDQDNVAITNNSDNGRETIFSHIYSGETITIDNDKRIITSTKENIYDRFNGIFFRMCRGSNNLLISGEIKDLVISYIPARKVGA